MKSQKLKIYKETTGLLMPISLKKNIPFKVKRIFIIHGKKNYPRGNHAHYKCSQFLIPLCGSIIIEYENKKNKLKKTLSLLKNNNLLLKPMTWCRIRFIGNNSKLLVFCDREYEPLDYIKDYTKFKTMFKKI
ncbi:FdtA/QdtA family cupin domain-containing protein [Candidatus Pelagibacter bacterium]|nr:FdtA/QdtA family cupin domain-containing protein [Candidatus Pelagibacter bacterium]MDA8844769.1 FdtA/QdtA family cupin domain-containing protein [Candidatus Pelagibacter bacterium]